MRICAGGLVGWWAHADMRWWASSLSEDFLAGRLAGISWRQLFSPVAAAGIPITSRVSHRLQTRPIS